MTLGGRSDRLTSQDVRNERRIFWSELAIVLVVAALVAAYVLAAWLRPGATPQP